MLRYGPGHREEHCRSALNSTMEYFMPRQIRLWFNLIWKPTVEHSPRPTLKYAETAAAKLFYHIFKTEEQSYSDTGSKSFIEIATSIAT